MTAPFRPSMAGLVMADFETVQRLVDSGDPDFHRLGQRVLNTLNGETGLSRSIVPMQSERSPATILANARRNAIIIEIRTRHFGRELDWPASAGIRGVLLRHRRARGGAPGSVEDLCYRFFQLSADVPQADAIRKILGRTLLTD